MKVLHVQKVAGIGGSERHLLQLLPALEARNIQTVMVPLVVPGAEAFLEPISAAGIRCSEIVYRRSLRTSAVELARLVQEEQPDVIHTHLVHADVLGQTISLLARRPSVSSVHATAAHYRRPDVAAATALALRRARRVIAISEHVRRFLIRRRLAPPSRVDVVRYGIDLADWRFSESDRRELRSSLGLGADAVAVLAASRLVPDKGHDFLLHAFARAVTQIPNLVLLTAGDGPLRSQLARLADGLGVGDAVRFLGFRGDVQALISASDIVVFPTLPGFGEGFGMVNLEAAALGRPVVASRVDSLPEIVVDGDTGYLVRAGDVEEFAERLVRLAGDLDLRLRMGVNARQRAEDEFSIRRMVDETVEVYQRVVGAVAGRCRP